MDLSIRENREDLLTDLDEFYKSRMASEYNRGAQWWLSTSGGYALNSLTSILLLYGLCINEIGSTYSAIIIGVMSIFNLFLLRAKKSERFIKYNSIKSINVFSFYDGGPSLSKKFFIDEFLTAGGRHYLNVSDFNSIYKLLKRKSVVRDFLLSLAISLTFLIVLGRKFFYGEFVQNVQFHIFNTEITFNDLFFYPSMIILSLYLVYVPFRKEDGYSFLKDIVGEIRKDMKA